MNTQDNNDFWFPDSFIEFISTPRKYPKSLYDATYRLIAQQGTLGKLIGIILANGFVVIFGLLFIYGRMPYWPPIYKDLQNIPFDLAFLLLIFTGFLVSTTVHFLIFRAVSGKGELIAHGYLSAIGSTWSLFIIGLAGLILAITRVKYIDAFVMILAGMYLIYVTFLSLRAIHQLSILRAVVAMITSNVATVPGMILYFYILAFLREARPYRLDDLRLLIFFLSAILLDLDILAYMFYEQRRPKLYPEMTDVQFPARITFENKFVRFLSIALVIPLTVLSGLKLYEISRPDPAIIESSSLKPLEFNVVDADYSNELDSIVFIS